MAELDRVQASSRELNLPTFADLLPILVEDVEWYLLPTGPPRGGPDGVGERTEVPFVGIPEGFVFKLLLSIGNMQQGLALIVAKYR